MIVKEFMKARAKEEIEKEIFYITEENIQLEKQMEVAKIAENKLKENRRYLEKLMVEYLRGGNLND